MEFGCENIPKISFEQVITFNKELREALDFGGLKPLVPKGLRGGDGGNGPGAQPIGPDHPECAPSDAELAVALGFLSVLDPEFEDYDAWERISRAIKTACGGSEDFYDLVYRPWQEVNPDNADHIRAKWESHPDSRIGWGYVSRLAEHHGFVPSGAGLFEALDDAGAEAGCEDEPGDTAGGQSSSAGVPPNAGPIGPKRPADQERVIANTWVDDVARKTWILVPYSRTNTSWKHFEDGRWVDKPVGPEWETGERCAVIGDGIRASAAARHEDLVRARWLSSANAATSVTRIAKAHPGISVHRLELDAHSWIMGVPGGYIDKQGRYCDPDPAMMITRHAGCAPAPGTCTRWERMVQSLSNYDPEVYMCLRAALGYTMSGTGQETKFFFLHGEDGNEGKSSFLRCLALVMGDYHTVLPDCAFVSGQSGDTKFAFGGLEGAWLAYTNEIEREQQWAMARLKDKTSASTTWIERKNTDGIAIPIHYGLWFQGNFLPTFSRPDVALRKRLVIFECKTVIAKDREQKDWANETFRLEGPQIMQWLLDARTDYMTHGLQIPASMQQHATEYLNTQDALGNFIRDYLVFGKGAEVPSQEVFDAWRNWGSTQNVDPRKLGTTDSFVQALMSHELFRKAGVSRAIRTNPRRHRVLIGVKVNDVPDEGENTDLSQ